jgi:hypothetical protein
MTDHEALEFVLDHVRKLIPRINALYLNNKGTADELALAILATEGSVSNQDTAHRRGTERKASPRGDHQRALRRI